MKTSAKNYTEMVEGTYVEPEHDVASNSHVELDNAKVICPNCVHQFAAISVHHQQQIAELTDAVDRLQKRVEELERREPW